MAGELAKMLDDLVEVLGGKRIGTGDCCGGVVVVAGRV